jgi:hypothetical protein
MAVLAASNGWGEHESRDPHRLKENAKSHQVSGRAHLSPVPNSSAGRVVLAPHPIRSSPLPVAVTPRRHALPAAAVAITASPHKATRTPPAMDFPNASSSSSSRHGAAARAAY